jgi:putative ABC transport system permease protein
MLLDIQAAIFFTGGLLVCLLILSGFALLVIRTARKFIPTSWNYEWRQGLANLYRPNNQTSTLLLTFGLGVTLISSLYLTQDLLLGTINFEDDAELPNLAMFDIQYDQNDGVNEIINENGIDILQNVPIVTMRLQSLKGRTVQEILNDTSRIARKWTLIREYRSTYRDSLISTETLSDGNFIGEIDINQNIVPISVEAGLMEDLNASLGDTIIWDVQGIPITSYISSTRLVNWQTPQPNFFVVFPTGVLEPAPQFFATTVNTPSKEASLNLQRDVVIAYPNVSAIDVGQIVGTIRAFLDRITFVIQFIGLFSIITGLIVLAGSAATSRYQRIRESVLLRTLGAKQIQVIKIQIIEYAFLGILAAFIGLSLSIATSWLIGYFYFGIEFIPNFTILGIEIALLVIFVLLIGLLNTRGIHAKPPLEILRQEG